MATSETAIANMALAHVGNSSQIANLDESSNEARACLLFYEQCRDEVLGAFPWPFATVIDELSLVTDFTASTDPYEWAFSYRYPSDALTIYRIPSGFDRAAYQMSWPCYLTDWPFGYPARPTAFRVIEDATGKLIYTDQTDATIEYTKRETDPTRFPADFTKALSLKLAADIAPMVSGGDPFKLGDKALGRYSLAISEAKVRAANEERRDPPPESELVTSRY
jgi:hypothetical protein